MLQNLKKFLRANPEKFYKEKKSAMDVVACNCNPATLEVEFCNGVSSIPAGGTVLQ